MTGFASPPPDLRSRSRRLGLFGALALMAMAACSPTDSATPAPMTVFAAASLTDALGEIASEYERETGQPVRLSFAASGAVARQVEAGAPAQVVVLADTSWMDRLQTAGRIQPDSRVDLLGNRLVLITAAEAEIEGEPLAWLARTGGRLVIGDPESVPAGAYARTWLQTAGLWDGLQPSIVTAADVRAARAFVARGEAQLAVVYRSDATGFDEVRVVADPPSAEQPSIVYPAAVTVGAAPASKAFLVYLRSPAAGAIFNRYGFEPLA
ncbi:MAG: molybdate ABC transporter substrate-binding protein [Alphaproteobacteria bacterium]|nr:molybdate ABC transporter substrate-binding protein [Alphaproteobacteria bacterium]MBU2380133.1 molybdate ABC transporter substrate-binding protein [Alphaproteobacteria bacterium]